MAWNRKEIASRIDHTALKATVTAADVEELCAEAIRWGFASVCVNPIWIPIVARRLEKTGIAACAVVGFPLGANRSEIKAEEARLAVKDGASEVDMVINIGALKAGDLTTVKDDIAAVVKAAKPAIVKVIIETCYLSDAEKLTACELAERAGAAFVKTSTGFGTGGASPEDVALMRRAVGGRLKVKASGGIRCRADAIAMLEAGADRIGASAGVGIVSESPED